MPIDEHGSQLVNSSKDMLLFEDHADGDLPESGRDVIMRIPVTVKIVLGTARMTVGKLMSLSRGSIVKLDQKLGGKVDIVVNDRVLARGEVVVLDDEGKNFAVSVCEVVGRHAE